ncbi:MULTISPECIES: SHOCT domain-containing protein [Halorussus]|uniref:SHOCT domain-containing protein n=1 Tax=Halorussus TaxID=1070314 RepID=UPI00209F9C09|nr:SHOCT domain-containing protein [Halorussus vallis]USZ73802.1 SHOCT domain-containing protein [Halorussus vallis]
MNQRSLQFEKSRLLLVLTVLTFGLTAFAAVLGLEFLVPSIFVLGFFIAVPLVALIGEKLPIVESENESDGARADQTPASDEPVARLRSRYADGELTHDEFERRLERLLETENVEAAGSRERAFDRK